MATIAPGYPRVTADHRFFLITSIVMALTVVAGFSTQLAMGRSTFGAPPLVHVHAVVFMGWVAFYVLQNALVATGSVALHKRLGWIGAVWAAVMVVLGTTITVVMVREGRTPFFFQPAYFLIMNPVSVLTFGGLTAAAIVLRRQTAWHRRLHFCGMAFLTGPAFGRLLPLPLLIPYAGWAVFAAVMLFPIAGIIADLRRTGRVHRAWWWGTGTLIVAQVAMSAITFSPLGRAIYEMAVAGSPSANEAPYDFPPPPWSPLITGGAAAK
jgi:hypothetical protein